MTRLQRTWATLFTLAVTCSLLFSTVAFALSDPKKTAGHADVVYHGTVPDLYKVGREVVVTGTYTNGVFRANSRSTCSGL